MDGNREFYNNVALYFEEFEEAASMQRDLFPHLFDFRLREAEIMDAPNNTKDFYFATGTGRHVLYRARRGGKIVTLDYAPEIINIAVQRLSRNRIPFKVLSDVKFLAPESIDDFFSETPNGVLIINQDFREFEPPPDYFDNLYCYCTLSHLSDAWKGALDKLLKTAKNGAISVYDVEEGETLVDYYNSFCSISNPDFRFKAWVDGRTIRMNGGFAYYCIPPEEMEAAISSRRVLKVEQLSLGKIYRWSPQNHSSPK